jgi:hypothetical protein
MYTDHESVMLLLHQSAKKNSLSGDRTHVCNDENIMS